MAKVRIGIIFGGRSEEHPISVKSVRQVAESLDREAYEPYFIGITRDGAWRLCEDTADGWETERSRPAVLSPDPGVHGLLVLDEGSFETIELDVVLPVLHGRFGEDGAIQGLFELSGIPYVGCDVAASAICMDKSLAYVVVREAGIATPDFWIVRGDGDVDPASLPYPVFVKPARSGSSFGVSKVTGPDELQAAIEVARAYDPKVLIESAVVGEEIGCSVLGDPADPTLGELDRVAVTSGFFRIHQEATPEQGSQNSSFIVPADISDEARALVRETAEAIYRALGCSGIARVDTFLTPDGRVVLNEVNTLPGLTSYSRYPRMMAAAGLPLTVVIDRIVTSALTDRRR
ncbi:D-alanine--D-alanine ligase family protein [Galbitalea sp. SE-J8]|uniref:D-alanine--D-alanine ligase family protein n=1 Tax=Galbitalea sp. SE-J8 TaxID=3054952 RepID=UPI00259CFD99|nr:D-alanine--D-alanine ligase family protein [Galbitalea sp. SE-J8]MDM4763992.1 D-alanine--D-alanine ligase family protein [Galbitalea sp. SE-J8]